MKKIHFNNVLEKDISGELKRIISEAVNVSVDSIKESVDLQKDLGIDSFCATEILVAVEQKFEIVIDPAEIFDLRTFRDVVDLIAKYSKGKK